MRSRVALLEKLQESSAPDRRGDLGDPKMNVGRSVGRYNIISLQRNTLRIERGDTYQYHQGRQRTDSFLIMREGMIGCVGNALFWSGSEIVKGGADVFTGELTILRMRGGKTCRRV